MSWNMRISNWQSNPIYEPLQPTENRIEAWTDLSHIISSADDDAQNPLPQLPAKPLRDLVELPTLSYLNSWIGDVVLHRRARRF